MVGESSPEARATLVKLQKRNLAQAEGTQAGVRHGRVFVRDTGCGTACTTYSREQKSLGLELCSYGFLGPRRLCHGRTRGPARGFSPPYKGLPVSSSCFWMPKSGHVPEEPWGLKYAHSPFSSDRGQGMGPSLWFRRSLPGPQLPSLQGSPPPQHWLGPAAVIFLFPSLLLIGSLTALLARERLPPSLWGVDC